MNRIGQTSLVLALALAIATPLVLLRGDAFDSAVIQPAPNESHAARREPVRESPERIALPPAPDEERGGDSQPSDEPERREIPRREDDDEVPSSSFVAESAPDVVADPDVVDAPSPVIDPLAPPIELDASDTEKEAPGRQLTLQLVWERVAPADTTYFDVAVDRRTADLYVGTRDTIMVLGPDGETERDFFIAQPLHGLQCAATRKETSHANPVNALDLVGGMKVDGVNLHAISATGGPLWTRVTQGWDIACVADLGRDGLDELILRCSGGIAVHDNRGSQLWIATDLELADSASTGDVIGDERLEVLASSSAGKVHLYDSAGSTRAVLDLGHDETYRWHVRSVATSGKDLIVSVGSSWKEVPDHVEVVGMTGAGQTRWRSSIPFQREAGPLSFEVEDRGRWGAIAVLTKRDGTELFLGVLDMGDGTLVARESLSVEPSLVGNGYIDDLAWLTVPGRESPLLVVATEKKLFAFELVQR